MTVFCGVKGNHNPIRVVGNPEDFRHLAGLSHRNQRRALPLKGALRPVIVTVIALHIIVILALHVQVEVVLRLQRLITRRKYRNVQPVVGVTGSGVAFIHLPQLLQIGGVGQLRHRRIIVGDAGVLSLHEDADRPDHPEQVKERYQHNENDQNNFTRRMFSLIHLLHLPQRKVYGIDLRQMAVRDILPLHI